MRAFEDRHGKIQEVIDYLQDASALHAVTEELVCKDTDSKDSFNNGTVCLHGVSCDGVILGEVFELTRHGLGLRLMTRCIERRQDKRIELPFLAAGMVSRISFPIGANYL
ncbi:hypothetical protein J3P80_08980 [Pseudomonas sp. D2-30]|uniref:hypothetical protein n=1 Tax=unclassified Pseudomonas TaxID=196821 RepID=UPI003B67FD41